MNKRYLTLASSVLLLCSPLVTLAADAALNTTTATSSINVLLSAINGNDGYLFQNPSVSYAGMLLSGSCTSHGTYQCANTRADSVGNAVTRAFSSVDNNTSLQLTDGTYTWISANTNAECYTSGKTRNDCVTSVGVGHYVDFQICSDGSCLPSSTPTSSLTTTDAVNLADFFIDTVAFAILIIYLFMK